VIAITKRRFRLDKRQSEEEDRKPHIRRFPTRALTSWGLAIELSLSLGTLAGPDREQEPERAGREAAGAVAAAFEANSPSRLTRTGSHFGMHFDES